MTMRSIFIPAGEKLLEGVVHEPYASNGKVLLICHGFRGSKEGGGRAVYLAEQAAMINFTVVRFDFTPLQCLTKQVQEINAAVAYCRTMLSEKIILLGRSMGGSASLVFAAQDKKLRGLCLWSTPSDLPETFRLALGEDYQRLVSGENVYIEDEYGKLVLGPQFIADFDQYDFAADIKRLSGLPKFILHGSQDAIVPLAQAKKLFQAASEPKTMTVIDGADHQFSQHALEATNSVITWLKTIN